jgi:uncharacterized protein YjbI with pentapeptide repeats
MILLRAIGEWFWQRREQILFIDHFLILAIGCIGVASVIYASRSFYLQAKIYEEQSFNREQGAVSLAWHTIADANNNASEIGQSNAVAFLLKRRSLAGKITLNRTQLTLHQETKNEPISIDLSGSNICGTNLFIIVLSNSRIYLSYALLKATKISGQLIKTYAVGTNFQSGSFDNVRAPHAILMATDLRKVKFIGGSFERADFQGADMRGVETYRGYSGAGTVYNDNGTEYGWSYFSEDSDDTDYPVYFSEASDLSPWKQDVDISNTVYLVDFRRARFLKADIRGADLSNSTINQTQVDEACADDTTKLPKGVHVSNYCTLEDWVLKRRDLVQRMTYEGRTKALEECDAASENPIWK